jgi:glutaredoxin 3
MNLRLVLTLASTVIVGLLAFQFSKTRQHPPQTQGSLATTYADQKKPVDIYTTPTCHFCHEAKAFFESRGIKYIEKDVTQPDHRAELKERCPSCRAVPQIFIGQRRYEGAAQLMSMDSEGTLAALLRNPE